MSESKPVMTNCKSLYNLNEVCMWLDQHTNEEITAIVCGPSGRYIILYKAKSAPTLLQENEKLKQEVSRLRGALEKIESGLTNQLPGPNWITPLQSIAQQALKPTQP